MSPCSASVHDLVSIFFTTYPTTIIEASIAQEVERFHLASIPIITQWISVAMILLDPLITSSRKLAMKLPYSYREKRTRKSRISAHSKRTKRWNGRRKDREGMAGKICPDKRAFFVEKFIITPGDRENNLTVIIYGLWVNRASLSRYLPLNADIDCEITL